MCVLQKNRIWILPVLLLFATGLAFVVHKGLSIEFREKKLPAISMDMPEFSQEKKTPLGESIGGIILPSGAISADLHRRAAGALAQEIGAYQKTTPEISQGPSRLPSGNLILVGEKNFSLVGLSSKSFTLSANFSEDSFGLFPLKKRGRTLLLVFGKTPLGEAYGLYYLAKNWALRRGDLWREKTISIPRLKTRMIEQGGLGLDLQSEKWGKDYSLHNREYSHILMEKAPFLKKKPYLTLEREFKDYVHHIISRGYNYLVMVGFLEYINFDKVGSGKEIYSGESLYRKRHLAFRKAFGRLYRYAHQQGVKVILKTDMAALTGPLEEYFRRQGLWGKGKSHRLWEVYRKGLEELFEVFPFLEGVKIRIGEAGSMYNLSHWDYRSELWVRTPEAVQTMLQDLLSVFEKKRKTLIFRTWSVGVGKIGKLHTHPEVYKKALGGVSSANLIVSTKYCKGDYFRFLSLNPTLMGEKHRRIVEFQARREYEGFSSYPNFTGFLYQKALQTFLKANPHIEGIWLWPQYGGPLHKSPKNGYPFHGNNLWIDANVWTTGDLIWNPEIPLEKSLERWIAWNFGSSSLVRKRLITLFYLSPQALRKGLYVSAFAEKELLMAGAEVPPMIWIFQWSWLCGSPAGLALIYKASGNRWEEMVSEAFEALRKVYKMRALAGGLKKQIRRGKEKYALLLKSLDYQIALFETLAWYRATFLWDYRYLQTGSSRAFDRFRQAAQSYQNKKMDYLRLYGKDLSFPTCSFLESDLWLQREGRNFQALWSARILLIFLGLFFLLGLVNFTLPPRRRKILFWSLWVGLISPQKLKELNPSLGETLSLFWAVLLFEWWGLSTFFHFSAPYTTAFLVFLVGLTLALLLVCFRGGAGPSLLPIYSIGLVGIGSLMALCSFRGPSYFWFLFWTCPIFRFLLVGGLAFLKGWFFLWLLIGARELIEESWPKIAGRVFLLLGILTLFVGVFLGLVGLKNALIQLNREILLLPLPSLEVLDFMAHIGIDPALPWYLAGLGGVVVLMGWGLMKNYEL